jgi:concanavalin A-like lectin/glucanase superfamily protein
VISKATNGFTAAQVDAVIRGDYGNPAYRSRFELIDRDGSLIRDITSSIDLAQNGITHNAKAADIKRQASITFRETTIALDSWLNTVLATSPLFFWRFNESSGGTAGDASGNGRTGTITGGITYSSPSLVLGDPTDAAFGFNGTNTIVFILRAAWMDVTRLHLSLVWKGTGTSQALINRDDLSSSQCWKFEITSGGFVQLSINFTTGSPTYKDFLTTAKVNDGVAHLLQASYDGANVTVYVDGIRVLKTAETRTMATSATTPINVGSQQDGTKRNSGTIDEVFMLGRALTVGEYRTISQRSRDNFDQVNFDTDYVRCFGAYEMPTNGTDGTPWAEWATFTGKLSSPSRHATEMGIYRNCALSDLSTLLKNNSFTSIYTVAAGENYITGTHGVLAIAALAGFDTSAWAVTATTSTLLSSLDFQIGSSLLDAINTLLLAINYRPFRFNGAGLGVIEAYALPESRAVEDTFAIDGNSIVVDDIEEATEIDQTTNTVVVTRADQDTTILRSTATNSDVTSATSTAITQRAPTVTKQIKAVPDQTTLDNLGLRFLAVSGLATRRLHISTLPRPFHDDEDKITFTDLTAENALNISKDTIEEEWVLPFDPRPMTHILRELDV